jgi:DNA repair protein RadC
MAGKSSTALSARDTRAVDRALRILKRALHDSAGQPLASPNDTRKYFQCRLAALEHEEFHACWLDAQFRLIATDTLFIGTLTQVSVYPREVVKSALRHNAAAAIFAHNHPSGLPEPSTADLLLTQSLRDALRVVDVQLLDHIIVSACSAVSLAERGMLQLPDRTPATKLSQERPWISR